MAISYQWKLTLLKKTFLDGQPGVVIGTRWECIGTDEDGNTGTFSGATPFKQIDPNNFTPFEDLTEEIVLSWIQPAVTGVVWTSEYPPEDAGGMYWEHVNGRILEQINLKKNPVEEVEQFPWQT